MQLTQAQKTALKAHMQANTNTVLNAAGQLAAINTLLAPVNGDVYQRIADWYNTAATGAENQPFTILNIWNPNTTIAQLNSAIKWQTPPVGATPADVTNSWLLYQSMVWNMQIDMSDASVRKGILQVFGDVVGGSAAAIGALGCGWLAGRRVELALSPAAVGAATNAWVAAHVVPKGLNNANLVGQPLTEPDVEDLMSVG